MRLTAHSSGSEQIRKFLIFFRDPVYCEDRLVDHLNSVEERVITIYGAISLPPRIPYLTHLCFSLEVFVVPE